ncbi:Glycerol kinase [Candidatus Lokiarchaeum ossiferum]|uniref:Glycerol kinase n=1 Tax=Candidatus Lokiarchaeum ossiferum TaxID=2951803 RepID=A0ABY6HS40_9ARCH|nr:Glycerol kinase [Candidatus Lokiarchaeum sp. B-35]
MEVKYVIAHDVGTTGMKSCLYEIKGSVKLLDCVMTEYTLYTTPDGGAEQDEKDWWNAICIGTKKIIKHSGHSPSNIHGISFTTQLQGSIMVDKNGKVLRRPMIWLDGRAVKEFEKVLAHGLIRIEGYHWFKIIIWLIITGGGPGTAKDPLFKYLWVKNNEPEVFEQTYKWLDVKDYLIFKCTGNYCMTGDSAQLTWLYDTRPRKLRWHKGLCKMVKVNMEHLPKVVNATDIVGNLTKQAALEMGLEGPIPIYAGGGDASNIPIGSGATDLYDTHLYAGTSGWVVSNVDKRMADLGHFCVSLLGGIPNHYNYIAEMETTGICLQWVRDHLALDEIGVYLDKQNIVDKNDEFNSLFDYMNAIVSEIEPTNIIFTPWLHGNRAPAQDPYVRGMFFNLGLNTGKREMIRSVLEGVAFNFRWCLEAEELKIPYQKTLRYVGGGAKSDVWSQIIADVTGRIVEVPEDPQNAGATGAAIICGIGLGVIESFKAAKKFIPIEKVFKPQEKYKAHYDKNFKVFKKLYSNNKKLYKTMNT